MIIKDINRGILTFIQWYLEWVVYLESLHSEKLLGFVTETKVLESLIKNSSFCT